MRIEQLVLYGAGEDDRVRFGPGVTVFSGLDPTERADLIDTIVDALAGRLANASLVYVDGQGRRVYADRNGASYADTGEPAPAPHDLLGREPDAVAALLTVTSDDLGLSSRIPVNQLHEELRGRRAQRDTFAAELEELTRRADLITEWREEQAELTERIDRHADDLARWEWVSKRTRLDEVRAELSMLDEAPDQERSDLQILQAVDALRSAGQSWANLAAEASELRAGLGPLPAVSAQDLTRVASTPSTLPPDLPQRVQTWQAAVDLRRTAEGEVAQAVAPPSEPPDPLVAAFASLDQVKLWRVHAELLRANEAYEQATVTHTTEPQDLDVEQAIESAHLEVVRCEHDVERKVRPGALAAALLVVTGLVAVVASPSLLGLAIALVAGAVAAVLVKRLVVAPHRALAAAAELEKQALAHTSAGSWLGLHLRRLDAVTDAAERKRFEQVSKARATAQLAWDDIAGAVSPADLSARADAVRAYAQATDPKDAARRIEEAKAFALAAASAEAAARASLTHGLEAYGVLPGSMDDLDPAQLATLLERRIAAGTVARKGLKLASIEAREAEAARRLDELLRYLGLPDGGLDDRLDRAIAAVTAARARQGGPRTREVIGAEIAGLLRELQDGARPSWAGTADPTGPPVDTELLVARRRELSELIGAAGRPDVAGATRRLELADARIAELDKRLDRLAGGTATVQDRLTDAIGRPLPFGPPQAVPALVDDAFASLPGTERLELLDLLLVEASRTQVVVFTGDDVVTSWSKARTSGGADVLLYELAPREEIVARPVQTPPEVTVF